MVQITIGGRSELQSPEADIVEGLVVNDLDLIGVFDELMHGEGGVVGLDDGVGHFGGWEHGEGAHDPVWVLLTDLGDQESSHAGASASSEGVSNLESLKAVAALGLLSDNVENGVDELGSFGVMALGPVVAGSGLAEDEVVGAEELTERSSSDGVHCAGLEIHENGAGHVSASSGLIVVHVDPLELKVGVSMIGTGRVNAMLVGDDLPELGADLVAALTSLNVNDFAQCKGCVELLGCLVCVGAG